MPRVDVDAVLRAKAPGLASWLRAPLVRWLRRTVCEGEINYILDTFSHQPPREFIQSCFRTWGVTYSIRGLDRLDPAGRYLFAANHPFGGMDGMMLADELAGYFGDARVVVNDLLMHLDPLRPLWIPVNKHGHQSADYARRFDEAFYGDLPILTFPAGLCSRRRCGVVADAEWKTNFVKRANQSQREIVPVFVEGRLSDFFYRLSALRRALGVKFNVEMIYLPHEMFSQKGRHFRMAVGDPIRPADLQRLGTLRQQADYVREKAYFLEKNLSL